MRTVAYGAHRSGRYRDPVTIAAQRSDDDQGHLVALAVIAVVVGVGAGLVAGAFRWTLEHAGSVRGDALRWAHGHAVLGYIAITFIAALACALAAGLVHRVEPHAEGSGIPRVEGVVEGRIEPARFRLLPVKFVGGTLAIGAGLPLGREGPLVQMGASVAHLVATVTRRTKLDHRILCAAGAGAGLAAAFNAPLAGGVFVLEELVKRFDTRITIATLATSGASIGVVHLMLGGDPVLRSPHVHPYALRDGLVVAIVAVVAGLGGMLYNVVILRGLRLADRMTLPVELRAGIVGALVITVAWWGPWLVGGGDNITERVLLGHDTLALLVGVFALRLVLGSMAYASGTPGGLFAPMLVLGAISGAVVQVVGDAIAPGHVPAVAGLGIIGMAAFFTASVRAPITGIVLATEMTGVVQILPPLVGACAIAMLLATWLRSEPIYDALTRRSIEAAELNRM